MFPVVLSFATARKSGKLSKDLDLVLTILLKTINIYLERTGIMFIYRYSCKWVITVISPT